MSSHLEELQSRLTISDRIAYLTSTPELLEELMEGGSAIEYIFKRCTTKTLMGFAAPKDSAAGDGRIANAFSDLDSILQEMLTGAYSSEIKEIAKECGLIS